MNRYLLKFEKKGALRYISHLDLMRLFRRTFKRLGVELVYSKGFNPHPKMSFAQPLSLGYSSQAEYLEFETVIGQNGNILLGLLNSSLPYGVTGISCHPIEGGGKSMASMVGFADYDISFPPAYTIPTEDQIENYLDQDTIIVLKPVKKARELAEIDIRPMIKSLTTKNNLTDTILATIHAGSKSNLNPELLLASLFEYCKLPLQKGVARIERLEIYNMDMIPLECVDK